MLPDKRTEWRRAAWSLGSLSPIVSWVLSLLFGTFNVESPQVQFAGFPVYPLDADKRLSINEMNHEKFRQPGEVHRRWPSLPGSPLVAVSTIVDTQKSE